MLVFPNAKINLGLKIIRKRSDGYHDIETVFYPLPLTDILEIIASRNNSFAVSFTTSGNKIDIDPQKNLCIKAYNLLKQDQPTLPHISMHLHKSIPMGAGLGGGSSDAAFTLQLLNRKFNLGLNKEKLLDYAIRLGSDCPFFIVNKPCYATGRGELLQAIPLDLSAYKFLIVYPGIHVSTEWAFSVSKPSDASRDANLDQSRKASDGSIILKPIETWKDLLINDFEEPVFSQYPEIKKIKENLYKAGAIYASMSGSGSTVYGIFKKDAEISFEHSADYFTKQLFS